MDLDLFFRTLGPQWPSLLAGTFLKITAFSTLYCMLCNVSVVYCLKRISISKTSGGNLEIVPTYVESRNYVLWDPIQHFYKIPEYDQYAYAIIHDEKSLQNSRQLKNNHLRILSQEGYIKDIFQIEFSSYMITAGEESAQDVQNKLRRLKYQ